MDDRYKNIKTKATVSVGHVSRLLESPYREKQDLNFSYRGFYETTNMTYTQPGRRRADVDDRYKNRCLKKLQNTGAPLDGWLCSQIDEREVLTTCELCGCANVRYLHEMFHPEYIGLMNVGCICAGILEGNELGAKKREIEARNRTQRRMRFILKHWVEKQPGIFNRRYHGYHYQIKCLNHQYAVFYRGKWCWKCKGQPMTSFSKAAGAIFHLIDPPVVTSR